MAPDIYPSNLPYMEELYRLWLGNPAAVPPDWRDYFERLNRTTGGEAPTPASASPVSASSMAAALHVYKQSRVSELISAYREIGYLQADLNPLRGYVTPGMAKLREAVGGDYRDLSLGEFDLTEDDLDIAFSSGKYLTPSRGSLRQIVDSVRETYCGAMGVEILHIQNRAMRDWLVENIESNNNRPDLGADERREILEDVIKAELFEHFIHSQFVGQKRFSLEGSESLIPALHALITRSAREARVEEIVLGMTHRGRLNVLVNLLGRPASSIFATFANDEMPFAYTGSGDVRYHLGYSSDHVLSDGSRIHVGMVANPSHLEAVDAVVEGKARGLQRRRADPERKKVIPILIHGDAAFAGQGVVAEVFNMSQLKGYRTGGTIHIVVNNQIGFTTASRDARSTFFPTDVAKSMPVPIIHVNGDKPEHVVRAMDLAFRFRQQFAYDAVVDIFCYRKYGHNEADDPTFTHPVMYETIRQLPSVATQYGEQLDRDGIYPKAEQEAFREAYREKLQAALAEAGDPSQNRPEPGFQSVDWKGFTREYDHAPVATAITEERFDGLAQAITRIPAGLPLHPKLARIIAERRQRFEQRVNIDWASAEGLAFASLLTEDIPVRLSGEDSGRGTFSQRHAVWWYTEKDTHSPKPFCPYEHLADDQARFTVYDSPLSEYSVLGFEYGLSLSQPRMLTLWEAQFGDFANGAQVVIDQFIAAAESKWDRSSGLVLLLPHGYSGQGPEHSSAHMERYLQLCAEENIQVCNMTTPAQYFHVLRRQIVRNFRKPLVIMAPKSLLRHKRCVSRLSDFTTRRFEEVLDDTTPPAQASVVLMCSGQVYYDLLQAREAKQAQDTAIIRLEQLYPFPREQLRAVLAKYPQAQTFVWVQEESRNRGAWTFMHEHIGDLLGGRELQYVGRKASASPATGSYGLHQRELQALLDEAFNQQALQRKAI